MPDWLVLVPEPDEVALGPTIQHPGWFGQGILHPGMPAQGLDPLDPAVNPPDALVLAPFSPAVVPLDALAVDAVDAVDALVVDAPASDGSPVDPATAPPHANPMLSTASAAAYAVRAIPREHPMVKAYAPAPLQQTATNTSDT